MAKDLEGSDPAALAENMIYEDMHHLSVAVTGLVTRQRDTYEQRLGELLGDLSVYKKYYQDSQAERNTSKHEVDTLRLEFDREKRELEKQLAEVKGHSRRVVALIDGDGSIFNTELLELGQKGGFAAARMLSDGIRNYSGFDADLNVWVYIFYNHSGLASTLARAGLVDKNVFGEFVAGFNRSDERFLMIDVGAGKELADARLRVYLEDQVKSPQTRTIFFGGCHDNGYYSTLSSLVTQGCKKLVLLPGYSAVATEIEKLQLPLLEIPDLFISQKITVAQHTELSPVLSTSPSRKSGTANPLNGTNGSIPGSKGRPTPITFKDVAVRSESYPRPGDPHNGPGESDDPASPVHSPRRSQSLLVSSPKQKRIIPSLPLWKHDPPPCNMFYLAECKLKDCKYGHDYLLTDTDQEILRKSAQSNPCANANNGNPCPFTATCIYGHKCPWGKNCRYRQQGMCKFRAKGMHEV